MLMEKQLEFGVQGSWDVGTYQFKLVEIQFGLATSQFKEGAFPAARFVFADVDGERLESSPIPLPSGLRYNDKSNFWKYIGALAGRNLSEDDVVSLDLDGDYPTFDSLKNLPQFFVKGETPVLAKSIMVNGQELIGTDRECLINLDTYESKSGQMRNKITGIIPVPSKSGKKSVVENVPV